MEAVKRVSTRAEQLSGVYQMGNVRAEYRDLLLWKGLVMAAFLPVGLVCLALIFSVIILSSSAPQGDWLPRLGQDSNRLPLLLWGVGFLLLGLLGLVVVMGRLWRGQPRIYLYERGVVYVRRRVAVAARWDEMQELRRHIFLVKNKVNNVQQATFASSYTVLTTGGKRYSMIEDPGPAIERAMTDSLWPAAVEDFETGKPLVLGWLTLDRQGIHLTPSRVVGDHAPVEAHLPGIARTPQHLQGTGLTSDERFLPWNALELCWIDETRSTLVISRKGVRRHWAIVPLRQVSNVALCLALIEYTQHDERRQPA
jgi:hypothetical protein